MNNYMEVIDKALAEARAVLSKAEFLNVTGFTITVEVNKPVVVEVRCIAQAAP